MGEFHSERTSSNMAKLFLVCAVVASVVATALAIDCYSGAHPLVVKNTCDDATVTQCYLKQKVGLKTGAIAKCGPGSGEPAVEDGCKNVTELSITFQECYCSENYCNEPKSGAGVMGVGAMVALVAVRLF